MKRNELLVYVQIWRKFKIIMLSERNKRKQRKKERKKRKRIAELRADYMQPLIT